MSNENKISEYLKFGLNVLDTRFTGCGKTTNAINLIQQRIDDGKITVFVAKSYKNLEEVKHQISYSYDPHIVTIKGRTQPGMCVYGEKLSQQYKHIRPYSLCKECIKNCGFKTQKKDFERRFDKKTKRTNKGVTIFSIPQLLPYVLKVINRKDVLIIVDDVSIVQMVYPGTSYKKETFSKIVNFLTSFNENNDINTILEIAKIISTSGFSNNTFNFF